MDNRFINISLQPIPTDPNESFAWKDSTLDRKLKELEERAKKQGDVQLDVNGFDKNIDKSIGNWSSLPKAPNSDILLLQKARGKITKKQQKIGVQIFLLFLEEKKVKKFLEDNYQHRQDLVSPLPEFKGEPKEEPRKYPGVGPKTREGNFLKLF